MNAAGLAEDSARLQLKLYDLFDENAPGNPAGSRYQTHAGWQAGPGRRAFHPGLPPVAYQLRFNLGDSSGEMIYTRIFQLRSSAKFRRFWCRELIS